MDCKTQPSAPQREILLGYLLGERVRKILSEIRFSQDKIDWVVFTSFKTVKETDKSLK